MARSRGFAVFLSASIFLALALAACGTPVRYPDDYPLSAGTAAFPGTSLVIPVPGGWTAVSARVPENNEGSSLVIAGGDSLRITIREISVDEPASAYYRQGRTAGLAALSRTLHDSAMGISGSGITEFFYGGKRFAEYEYAGPSGPRRVVVFAAGESFYECEAFSVRPLAGRLQYDSLFSAQQAVLRSLR